MLKTFRQVSENGILFTLFYSKPVVDHAFIWVQCTRLHLIPLTLHPVLCLGHPNIFPP